MTARICVTLGRVMLGVTLMFGLRCTRHPASSPGRAESREASAERGNGAAGATTSIPSQASVLPTASAASASVPNTPPSVVEPPSSKSTNVASVPVPLAPAPDQKASKAVSNEPPKVTWRKALTLFKQKKFELACPAFEAAATAMRTNGAAWGDLGLCEYKLGNTAASAHASLLAVHYGNEAVRKAAYYNLGLAEAVTDLSVGTSADCRELASPAELECAKPAFVCFGMWQQYGTGMGTDGTVAFVASERQRAELLANEYESHKFSYTDASEPDGGFSVTKGQRCFAWCARHPEIVPCVNDCKEGDTLSCSVVAVDACHARVGYVCSEWEEVGGAKRMYADEFEFSEEGADGQ